MKKLLTVLLSGVLLLSTVFPVSAANGKVTYDGAAREFIFAPGSEHSLTDLFPNFKDVMPGDTLTQKIVVKNDASRKVKVKIYIRSLGAHEDSWDFLSQLRLKVEKSKDNEMGYMFDAAADETAQLYEWVCLGTLYSGGKVSLNVTLEVPDSLNNTFKNQIGYLDWQFMVEEFPVENTDPEPPKTGDASNIALWAALLAVAVVMLIWLLLWKRKKTEGHTEN